MADVNQIETAVTEDYDLAGLSQSLDLRCEIARVEEDLSACRHEITLKRQMAKC
jgi:hypothetical protein